MHTEPTPVQPIKRQPPTENSELPPTAEELENVTIRVVRLDQLAPAPPEPSTQSVGPRNGTQRSPASPAPAAAPPAPAAPVVKAPSAAVPAPVARTPASPPMRHDHVPAARPAEVPAARQIPGNRTATTVARPSARAETVERRKTLSWNRVAFIALVIVLYLGWTMPTERYITPTRGFGYALGIIGGSLMLLLLVYSARKHFRWLRFLGPTPSWFRFHMVLGILGPLCILFHSNFKTGAANSNVALFCMLTVASSGFIGRYLYANIHAGLYGRKLQLGELQASAAGLRELSNTVSFLPDLVTRLEVAEQRLLQSGPRLSLLGFLKPPMVAVAAVKARWQLHGYVRRGLRASAHRNTVIAAESKRLRRAANGYVDRRLSATRRLASFQGYERLFSLWHALHIPLIFMLIIAAVVHVIAVNVY
jgi:hypothetical protein